MYFNKIVPTVVVFLTWGVGTGMIRMPQGRGCLCKGHQTWVSRMALSAVRGDPTAIFGNFTALL